MKVHPNGTLEGSPAECAEYHRIFGEQRVYKDTQTKTPPVVTGIGDSSLLEQIRRQNELNKTSADPRFGGLSSGGFNVRYVDGVVVYTTQ